jgi:hypothetical protein
VFCAAKRIEGHTGWARLTRGYFMTTAPDFFNLVISEINNDKISDMLRFDVSVNLSNLLKKAATDRQWVVKHLPQNPKLIELFGVFIEKELKPKLSQLASLQAIDFSRGIPSAITTHHLVLRQAFELFIQTQLEALSSFEFNIERDSLLNFKKVLFYLGHTLNFETNNEQLQKLVQTMQDKLAQDLFFTSTYLLMNQNKSKITSRIQIEWLASQFLNEEKASIIEYIIGHWTRKMLIHNLIAQALKTPEQEPGNDDEKIMVKEIIFTTKPDNKNK